MITNKSADGLRNEIEHLRRQLAREIADHDRTKRVLRNVQAQAEELRGQLTEAQEGQYTVHVPGGEVAPFQDRLSAQNFAAKVGGTVYAPNGVRLGRAF